MKQSIAGLWRVGSGFNLPYLALSVLSGLLIMLADFPTPVALFMFVNIAPLMYVAYKARPWPSFVYTLVAFTLGYGRILYGHGSAVLPLALYLAVVVLFCLPYALLGTLASWLSNKVPGWLWALVFPAGCVLIEALEATFFLGVCGSASGPVAELGWLLAMSSVGGIYLVTLLVRLVPTTIALALAEADSRRVVVPAIAAAALVAVSMIYGTFYHLGPKPLVGGERGADGRIPPAWDRTARVAAVNYHYPDEYFEAWCDALVSGGKEAPREYTWKVVKAYERLIRRAAADGAAVVGTPEGSYFVPASMVGELDAYFGGLSRELGITIVTGRVELAAPANEILIATSDGKTTVVRKHHLVMGMEASLFAAGPDEPVVVEDHGLRISAKICYDGDFPPAFRQMAKKGVDLVVIPSSDWWSIALGHYREHSYRGVENGMALLRPAGGGFSAIVDPYGNTVIRGTPDGGKEPVTYLVADVPIKRAPGTPYTVLGDWVVCLSLLLVVAGVAVAVVGSFRRRKTSG